MPKNGKESAEDDASLPLKSTAERNNASGSALPAEGDILADGMSRKTMGKFIYVLAFFSAIGGFLFGYDTGVVSGAMLIIRKEMELSTGWHEAIVSGTIAAAWVFALVGGYLSDRFGRKPVILAASFVFAIGSIVMGAADGKEALLAGRVIVGIGIGWTSSTVAIYIAESSPLNLRGPLVAFQSVMITMGRFSGALVSAVVFSTTHPPVTGLKQPALVPTMKNGHRIQQIQWLDVLDFSGRSMAIPMYLAEAASSAERGMLVTLNVMFITGGQALAAVFSGALSNATQGWRWMLGIAAIPAVIQLVGFMLMPESPRWLISHGRPEEARRVLQRIRGPCHDIDEELEAIKASADEAERELGYRRERGQTANVLVQIFQSPPVRRALFLGCLLQMFQQIAGINTVMYYSATIIQMAGFYDTSKAIWLSALVASVNFICTFLGLYLVERVGRRRLTLGSLLGVVFSLAFLAIGFMIVDSASYSVSEYFYDKNDLCASAAFCNECNTIQECGFCFMEDPVLGIARGSCLLSKQNTTSLSDYGPCADLSNTGGLTNDKSGFIYAYGWCPSPHGWITVLGLMTYLLFFAPGMGPMPWTVNAEIYPLWARSTCNSIATSANWFFNFLVSMTFLTLTEILTREGAFWFYCALASVGLILFYWLLPETKGRTLEEMEILFSRPRSCPRPWKMCRSEEEDLKEEPSVGGGNAGQSSTAAASKNVQRKPAGVPIVVSSL